MEYKTKSIMHKEQVRLTQVYRINGRLVVANSIEGAINTWREWMRPNCPDINNIELMSNDALVFAEGLCGDLSYLEIENIARQTEEREKQKAARQKCEEYRADLERRSKELSTCVGK